MLVDALPPELTAGVAAGELAYAWTTVAGQPSLVVGGRFGDGRRAGIPAVYFIHDATTLESTLDQLRLALIVGTVALILVALVVARSVARGVLAPVEAASRAAERIEGGDLSARVPVTSDDEFGAWAERFNRMAEALGETIGRLEAAEGQNRRFVADVAHELRTPLAALVAEASILREDLGSLPDASRRAGELLVADVARLRVARRRPHGDLAVRCRRRADRRRAGGRRSSGRLGRGGPAAGGVDRRASRRRSSSTPTRAGSNGSWATCSTTPASMPPARRSRSVAATDAERSSSRSRIAGPGVPPERLAHIFERFYKADPSRHAGSSGLGLAIAAEHAELLGGSLTAEARTGGGLRLELRLPVTRSLPAGDEAATSRLDGED